MKNLRNRKLLSKDNDGLYKRKCNFVKQYFDNKTLNELKHTIRPSAAWDNIDKDAHIWINELNIPANTKIILEIGCGIGRLLKPLSEKFICYGIDASRGMIIHGKDYAPNAIITLCDGTGAIDFPPNFFDFVFSLIVFQHIENIETVEKYIQNTFRVLQRNGTGRFQVLKVKPKIEYPLKTYHNHNELMKFMEDTGYKNINKKNSLYSWTIISGTKL